MTLNVTPRADSVTPQVIKASQWERYVGNHAPNHVIDGFDISAGSGLNARVAPGLAWIRGLSAINDAESTVAMAASNTNYLFLAITRDSNGEPTGATIQTNTTGREPALNTLVSRYKFDGNANDNIATNNGTEVGSPTYVLGRFDKAINLNGTTQTVSVADHASIDFSTAFMIAVLVKFDTLPASTQSLVKKDGAYLLDINSSGQVTLNFWNSTVLQTPVTGATTLRIGRWYWIVGTYDGANLKVYVNGVLDGTQAETGTVDNSANALYIGSSTGTTQWVDGQIDEVRLYSTALGANFISVLAEASAVEDTMLLGTATTDGAGVTATSNKRIMKMNNNVLIFPVRTNDPTHVEDGATSKATDFYVKEEDANNWSMYWYTKKGGTFQLVKIA